MVSPRSSYVTAGLTFLPGAADKRVQARKGFPRAGSRCSLDFVAFSRGTRTRKPREKNVSYLGNTLACDVY